MDEIDLITLQEPSVEMTLKRIVRRCSNFCLEVFNNHLNCHRKCDILGVR